MKGKSRSANNSPDHPKRPYSAPVKQHRQVCDRRSYLTEEEVRRVVREELDGAKSHPAEYCQSCTGNALKELVQLMHSMEKWMHSMNKSIWELKEAAELAIIHPPHVGRANAKSTAKNYARNLQLQLQTKLSLPLFTGKKLEGKGGARISVALIDANTGDVITSGPESSIKLDVVVLEGDFNKDDEENWTQEEFEDHMVKHREGRRPLLTGNLLVTLKEGVGELGELLFTDNSSWNRSKMFRMGLKVASGYCGNTRIREAITDAFPVKEHRGVAYTKHYPPAPDDEVWRLEKIAKDGKSHQKLSEAGIHRVEDLLLQLSTDAKKLREILGKSVTPTNWEILVDHAKTCKINRKLYLCYSDGLRKHGAVFNTDGQLIGLIKDGEYLAAHRLSAQEKEHGDAIVKEAFDNWNDVREFNGETFSGSMQEKRLSSFPSQVFEGQIEKLNPVELSLAPQVFTAPVGPEAPPVDGGYTSEGHNGATALALPVKLQNTNSGNAMKLSVNENVCLAAHQPTSTDCLNVLIPPGDNGITTVGLAIPSPNTNYGNAMELLVDESVRLAAQQPISTEPLNVLIPQGDRLPIESHDNNFQYAMHRHTIHSSSQMDNTVNQNVSPSEPPSAAISSSQSSRALRPRKGNHVIEDLVCSAPKRIR